MRHHRPEPDEDDAGPTLQRIVHAAGFYDQAGQSRSSRRIVMHDSPLGRAWMRQKLSPQEYYSLRRYAHHWASAGLQGGLQSADLDRVFAHDPANMGSRTDRQLYHRGVYYAAREEIGTRPAFVADHVVLMEFTLADVGAMLGYQSAAHGRRAAGEILADAGHRLARFWKDN
jgi:hypothetical protein